MDTSRLHSLVLSSLLLGALAACSPSSESKPPSGAGGPPPAEVNVMTVAVAPVDLTTELSGRLQAVRTAQVRARVEGVVEKILFKEGADIQAGAPLFQIDPRTYQAAMEVAQTDAQAAEQVVQRYRALLEVRGVSQQEFEAAQTRAKQAKASLSKASIDYENAMVSAPISGRVAHALVTVGALVGKGDATPLVNIDQLDPIYVNLNQSENELANLRQAIKQGQLRASDNLSVQLLLPDGSVYSQTGKLLLTEQTVDVNTGNVFLRAEFANPQRELLPGSFVRVRLSQARMTKALVVPQRAVQMNSNGAYVLSVTPDQTVAAVPIQIGPMSGDQWVVMGGLTEGTRIVVDGLQKVRPGAKVKPIESAASLTAPAGPGASATPSVSSVVASSSGQPATPTSQKGR